MSAASGYDHITIEAKWRKRWEEQKLHNTDVHKAERPFYNLMMFPYPSAEGLHVGNVFAFLGSDIYARFTRMQGYDVFEPMGFDAFGMHSENYALKIGTNPRELTPRSIRHFREKQMKMLGAMFDWSHEVQTTDPAYYKWTQWIFIQLFKQGLAYKKKSPVNWCPSCKTVLADEQVMGGACERCRTEVGKRDLEQWYFRITKYAQRLLDNLDWIDWSETTKMAQRNWIGRSDGADLVFELQGRDETLTVFTTRPDTIFGATYMVLAPEHPLVGSLATDGYRDQVKAYVAKASRESEIERQDETREKTGVFTGSHGINPATGNPIPIWISDYVLMGYGTGAIMAVPAHDQRDFEFARKFELAIVQVISPDGREVPLEQAYVDPGVIINSGEFNGIPSEESKSKMTEWLAGEGKAEPKVNYRLRDWCISRQRYWGPPIPIIYCDKCGAIAVPDEDLPVMLPELADYRPDGTGLSPLARSEEFINTACPACGGPAKRETDVNDNFLDSAWYFLRYPSTEFPDRAFDTNITKKWLPVDMYIGGNEHACLHLMYTRFITMALHDAGLIEFEEPFKTFRAHGMIIKDGDKMSKSRGNIVNPDEYIENFGADCLRSYLMFMGPYLEGGDFRDEGIKGVRHFLERVWRRITEVRPTGEEIADPETLYAMHFATKAVTEDIRRLSYNTALARLMEMMNHAYKADIKTRIYYETLLRLLAPFAPHLAEELWERMGHGETILVSGWPAYDEIHTRKSEIEFVVQINGKVRSRIRVPADLSQEELEPIVFADEKVKEYTSGKTIVKKILVRNKLMNIVVR
ncbi:MAG: leucine--tRNA ligase [Candidatus Eisenbacteria sp.]|nr:leucine--tRNA ligase [Candidatus Eisenbacteria bacterium]